MSRPSPSASELATYATFVRRYRVLLLASVVLGTALGLGYQHLQPKSYTSVASIALEPLPTYVARDPVASPAEYVTIDTDAQLAKSSLVLLPVAEVLDDPVDVVRDHLRVTASPLSTVLHLAFSAPTPELARVGAQTAADMLLEARKQVVTSSLADQSNELTESINVLERQLQGASKSFDTARTQSLNDQIIVLRHRLREVQLVERSVGRVIAAAELPTRGAGTSAKVALGGGALTGLLGGLAVARLLEVRHRRPVAKSAHLLETAGRPTSA